MFLDVLLWKYVFSIAVKIPVQHSWGLLYGQAQSHRCSRITADRQSEGSQSGLKASFQLSCCWFYFVSNTVLNCSFIFRFSICSNRTKAAAFSLTGSSEVAWSTIKFIFHRENSGLWTDWNRAGVRSWRCGRHQNISSELGSSLAIKQNVRLL